MGKGITCMLITGKPVKNCFIILKLVQDYNKNMGGVGRNDALIGNYNPVHKSLKWTKKVAFYFIEEALLNAFILFNKANPGKIQFIYTS